MSDWVLVFFTIPEEIIVVNMETEPTFKKMDTVVKLDSVSCIFYCHFKEFQNSLSTIHFNLILSSVLMLW